MTRPDHSHRAAADQPELTWWLHAGSSGNQEPVELARTLLSSKLLSSTKNNIEDFFITLVHSGNVWVVWVAFIGKVIQSDTALDWVWIYLQYLIFDESHLLNIWAYIYKIIWAHYLMRVTCSLLLAWTIEDTLTLIFDDCHLLTPFWWQSLNWSPLGLWELLIIGDDWFTQFNNQWWYIDTDLHNATAFMHGPISLYCIAISTWQTIQPNLIIMMTRHLWGTGRQISKTPQGKE